MSMRREKRMYLKSSSSKRYFYHLNRSQARWNKRKASWLKK